MLKNSIKRIIDLLGVEIAIKKNLWYNDAWKLQERLLIDQKKPMIIDVGACDGGTVKKYKELFPGATIHAFEPQPNPYKNLQSVAASHKDIYANNMALSDHNGKTEFIITAGYASSSILPAAASNSFVDDHTIAKEKIPVVINTLDNYAISKGIQHIHLLKMDVQGSELNVLKGAEKLLAENKIDIIYSEVWFKEAYEGQPYFEDIALFLRKYKFRTLGIYDMHRDFLHNAQYLWADAIFVKG